jgi:hypothetical protein
LKAWAAPDHASYEHNRGAGIQAASAERTAYLRPVNPSAKRTALTITMNINKLRRPVRFGILDFGFWIVLTSTLVVTQACTPTGEQKPPASPSPAASASPAASPVASPSGSLATDPSKTKADALVGRWPGEGGAYLNITKKGDKYTIEIANLSGPKTFEGTAKGDVIEFTRSGKTETIKAASGGETGMKGFEKDTNCVVVTKGTEGYCKK